MKELILFLCLVISSVMTRAQSVWELGAFVGVSGYSGDVNPTLTPRFQDFTPSLGVIAHTNLSNRLGFRGGITYIKLKGDDDNYPGREVRDFDFSTNLVELSILGEWEPFGSNRYFTDAAGNRNVDRLISPYLFTGVALIGGVLNTNFSNFPGGNEEVKVGILKDRGYGNSLLGVSIPVGIGMKFDIADALTLGVEGCIRASFSDYLDGISFSGSPDAKDIYMNGGIILYYRFGR